MADAEFQHLRLSRVKDVAVVEIRTREIHGPQLAQELGHELATVTAQDWARRLLVNFRRVAFLSSTGFAALFRLVRRANPEARTLVITGARSEVDQQLRQVLAEGADAVCYKPFDVKELLATLERLTAI